MPSFSSKRLLAVVLAALASSTVAINPGFSYGSDKVRGVNLGGWLVLEPWITPSLFERTGNPEIVDEFTFGQYQDRGAARQMLREHWDNWITEGDFADIKGAGLNHVRIPIGFWAFDTSGGEPYVDGQEAYLDRAVGWARNHGLKVIVDLHGVPGSQNGFDNSGLRTSNPTWHTNSDNVRRTRDVIKRIADKYKDSSDVVTAIEAINEPAGFRGNDLLNTYKQFARDAYGDVRYPYGSGRKSDTLLVISDAFQDLSTWNGFMPASDFDGVAIDTHIYQVFSPEEVARSEDDHINVACAKRDVLNASGLLAMVGEWSPARTDCAKYLNGRGIGSRYDGTYPGSSYVGSCYGVSSSSDTFNDGYKRFLRRYWEAQVQTYETAGGWIMWTWKAEDADDWSYQAGLRGGWIPYNPTDYRYPNICG